MFGTCSSPKFNTGVTLIEAMVVVVILGALTALVTPMLQDSVDRYRANTVYDELRSTYVLARSEAISSRSRVIVQRRVSANCATVQEWQCGWIVYADANGDGVQQVNPALPAVPEPSLRSVDELLGATTVMMHKGGGNISQVVFDRWGNITPLGAFRQVIAPRGDISSSGVRTLCVSSGGRFRLVNGDASDAACTGL